MSCEALDPSVLEGRKWSLVRSYARPIRVQIQQELISRLGANNLSAADIDWHARQVIERMIDRVHVEPWPPSSDTDREIENIIDEYLS